MNREYRDETSEFLNEANWTIGKLLPTLALIVIVSVVIGWFLTGSGIIKKDIEREVVQHSRQYVEGKQLSLQNLYTKYVSLQTDAVKADSVGKTKVADAIRAQQMALLNQIKREAINIPSSEIPGEVRKLIGRR